MTTGIELDYETGDRIAVCVLKQHYDYTLNEIKSFDANTADNGHLKEMKDNLVLKDALKIVLQYFGETV